MPCVSWFPERKKDEDQEGDGYMHEGEVQEALGAGGSRCQIQSVRDECDRGLGERRDL